MTTAGTRRADRAPRRRSRLVAGAFAALVVLIGAPLAVVLTGDAGDPADDTQGGRPGAGPGGVPGGDPSTTIDPPDPLDDPLSPESIDLRYSALADRVTDGATDCRRGTRRRGESGRIVCDLTGDAKGGRLQLVTYRTAEDLRNRRESMVTDQPGGVRDTSRAGTLMAFEPAPSDPAEADDGSAASTYLYADAEASLQSAVYTLPAGGDLDRLVAVFDATDPTRPFPTGPSSARLVSFARRWVDPDRCVRTVTVNPGALEESYCDVDGPVEVFIGRFATRRQLTAYRKILVASAIADDRDLRDWTRPQDQDPAGALYEYRTDDGTVSRYWDDTDCLCYAEAFRAKGSYAQLARWWEQS